MNVLGFRGPFGAFVCAWGGAAMIASAPFDNWWHEAYGLDVRIVSPPHTLLAMGMGERQLAEIAATRKLTQEVVLPAPVDGFIVARNVSPGLRFDNGLEFYRVADLSRVWIVADLYESDAASLHPGSVAKVTWHGKTLHAIGYRSLSNGCFELGARHSSF